MGPGNHVLDGCSPLPTGRGNFEGGKGRPIVKYRDTLRSSVQKTAEPIEMPFGLWAWMGPRNRVLHGVQIPSGKGQFWGKGAPIVKFRNTLRSPMRK